jgi:hypothetical protein
LRSALLYRVGRKKILKAQLTMVEAKMAGEAAPACE